MGKPPHGGKGRSGARGGSGRSRIALIPVLHHHLEIFLNFISVDRNATQRLPPIREQHVNRGLKTALGALLDDIICSDSHRFILSATPSYGLWTWHPPRRGQSGGLHEARLVKTAIRVHVSNAFRIVPAVAKIAPFLGFLSHGLELRY